jgi:hypothetical protein
VTDRTRTPGEIADSLEGRADYLKKLGGNFGYYGPGDADLDREAARALRSSAEPSEAPTRHLTREEQGLLHSALLASTEHVGTIEPAEPSEAEVEAAGREHMMATGKVQWSAMQRALRAAASVRGARDE